MILIKGTSLNILGGDDEGKAMIKEDVNFSILSKEEMSILIKKMNNQRYVDSFSNGNSGTLYACVKYGRRSDAKQIVTKMISYREDNDYRYPTIEGYLSVGFMYGLAGIGYSLLKYCCPNETDIPLLNI